MFSCSQRVRYSESEFLPSILAAQTSMTSGDVKNKNEASQVSIEFESKRSRPRSIWYVSSILHCALTPEFVRLSPGGIQHPSPFNVTVVDGDEYNNQFAVGGLVGESVVKLPISLTIQLSPEVLLHPIEMGQSLLALRQDSR
ncbi:hypothetical protein PM082_024945 [Marasmius tenuissimus]|nr:hypothetical protein PM082_024945 [Marasmius tenuissimus]